MIPYMVGKLAPNSSHLTRGLVKYVPGRVSFRAVSYQNGDQFVTSPPPPTVELVSSIPKPHLVRIRAHSGRASTQASTTGLTSAGGTYTPAPTRRRHNRCFSWQPQSMARHGRERKSNDGRLHHGWCLRWFPTTTT